MRGISLSLAAMGTLFATAFSQPPSAPALKTLNVDSAVEDLLAFAVTRNSDILAAEAKLREAEAEVRRTKMIVINSIVTTRMKLDAARKLAVVSEQEFAQQSEMRKKGVNSESEVRRAEAQLRQAKLGVAEVEAVMNTLTGIGAEKFQNFIGTAIPGGAAMGRGAFLGTGGGEGDGRPPVRPPQAAMADKIRKALDAPIKAADFQEIPLKEVIDYYRQISSEVPFVASLGGSHENSITLKLGKELPLGAHLQALQDVAPGLMITVRNYGFFLTFDTPPEDGLSYLDFWHENRSPAKLPPKINQ